MLRTRPSFSFLTPSEQSQHQPLFVYLPGMDGTGELFCVQTPHLAAYFDIRCLAIPADDLSPWNEMADRVIQLVRQEATNRPVYLCGESFGACLAMQVVAQAPDIANHLILINPASSFHRIPWLHWIANMTAWVLPTFYNTSALGSLPLLAALNRIRSNYHTALLKAMRSVTQESAAWRLSLLSQFRPEELNLQRFTAPTLIIASQADRLLPSIAEAQHLSDIFPEAKVHTLPYSGHISLLEDDVNLNQILELEGFLPQTEPPKADSTKKVVASAS
jgi:pimeloyl-ACP methyl ester carboxylesterase